MKTMQFSSDFFALFLNTLCVTLYTFNDGTHLPRRFRVYLEPTIKHRIYKSFSSDSLYLPVKSIDSLDL